MHGDIQMIAGTFERCNDRTCSRFAYLAVSAIRFFTFVLESGRAKISHFLQSTQI
jgi:hypothetical protein